MSCRMDWKHLNRPDLRYNIGTEILRLTWGLILIYISWLTLQKHIVGLSVNKPKKYAKV